MKVENTFYIFIIKLFKKVYFERLLLKNIQTNYKRKIVKINNKNEIIKQKFKKIFNYN